MKPRPKKHTVTVELTPWEWRMVKAAALRGTGWVPRNGFAGCAAYLLRERLCQEVERLEDAGEPVPARPRGWDVRQTEAEAARSERRARAQLGAVLAGARGTTRGGSEA